MTRTARIARFSPANNHRRLAAGWYRVWAYGESAICRTLDGAVRARDRAQRWDTEAHIVDADGDRVIPPAEEAQMQADYREAMRG